MAGVLQAPRPVVPLGDQFVEKRMKEARARVRLLDMFSAGLTLFIGSMFLLLAWLLVDRYVVTPPGTGWAALGGWILLAGAYLYWSLLRPSRRQINPYYAACQVERTIPDAKNSVINYVDLQDDEQVPESIRTAVATRAARDLKQVDINRAIERKQIIWLAFAAAIAFAAALVAAFLPPTRTEITLNEPKGGDVTVFSGQDLHFSVHLAGRVPPADAGDSARLRIWYNPDDPSNFEDRPLIQSGDNRRIWNLTIPAKQMRSGFQYQVRAGNDETQRFTVTYKIIPEFYGYEVRYEYPAYTKRTPETTTDANLVANYGTQVTLTAQTNRDVASGFIEIDGQPKTHDGQLVPGKPQSIQFKFPLMRDGTYRIWFTTTEGDKNSDPPRFRMTLLDPKPAFYRFDIAYDYPAYLRFKPMTARGVSNPEIEAKRGTMVTLTAHATRPVKEAKLLIDGEQKPIMGKPVDGSPASVTFKLPMLDKQTGATLSFVPTTPENPSEPKHIPIRVLADAKPEVVITKTDPKPGLPEGAEAGLQDLIKQGRLEEIQVRADGTLKVEGLATDDHGVAKINLRMEVVEPPALKQFLKEKSYRDGKLFLRDNDKSYPTRVEYLDIVQPAKLQTEKGEAFAAQEGMLIEFWLEAIDNCDVPPGANYGVSTRRKMRIIGPEKNEQKRQDQQKKEEQQKQEQQQHNKQQDQKNQDENRDPNQQPPPGANKDDQKKDDQKKDDQKKDDNQKKDGEKDKKDNKGEGGEGAKKDQPKDKKEQGEEGQDKKNGEGGKSGAKKEDNDKGDPKKSNDSGKGGAKQGEPKADPKQDQQAERDAEQVKDALAKQDYEKNKGQTKPQHAPPEQGPPPKEASKDGGMNPEPKEPPEPKEGANNQGPKKEGEPKPPAKGQQKSGGKEGGKNDAAQPKPEPKEGEGNAGKEKPTGKQPEPKKGQNGSTDPKQKEPGMGKGNSDKKQPEGDPQAKDKKDNTGPGAKKSDKKDEKKGGNNTATKDSPGKKPEPKENAKGEPGETEEPAKAKPQPNNPMGKSDEPQKGVPKPGSDPGNPNTPPNAESKPEPKDGNPSDPQLAKGDNKPDPGLPPKEGKGGGGAPKEKLDPKALKEMADKLKNSKGQERANAEKKLKDLAADKQLREEAQKKLEEMLKNATDEEKKELADAMKELDDAIKKNDEAQAKKDGDAKGNTGKKGENPKETPDPKLAKEGKNLKDGKTAEPKKEDIAKSKPTEEPMNGKGKEPRVGKGNGPKEPKEGEKKDGPDAKVAKGEPKDGDAKDGAKQQDPTKGKGKGKDAKGDAQVNDGGKREGEAGSGVRGDPMAAELKNRLKTTELQLETFKRDKERIQEAMKWDDKQTQDFMKSQEDAVKRLRAEVTRAEEKAAKENLRVGKSSFDNRVERLKIEPTVKGADALRGGNYTPPPGFDDSFKLFTEELSGVRKK